MNELNQNITIAYIAKPVDSRCQWWSIILPTELELTSNKLSQPYLRNGADLELIYGQMLINSEANHHNKSRGYCTSLLVSFGDEYNSLIPTSKRKKYIKEHGGQDLMHESGDVAGCVRMAVWLRRQSDLKIAFDILESVEDR
ncbi:hypothetical protein [Methylobacter psychrophilus]|uniref:hypothetical protein n=1 Tax=Methylobacter psychrophilus TaxID=96941 RepID=UPI0021D50155|nr:hypothetical protein [Methylobacter psychrophilus]